MDIIVRYEGNFYDLGKISEKKFSALTQFSKEQLTYTFINKDNNIFNLLLRHLGRLHGKISTSRRGRGNKSVLEAWNNFEHKEKFSTSCLRTKFDSMNGIEVQVDEEAFMSCSNYYEGIQKLGRGGSGK